jgi:hypothetical protein
MRGAQTPPYTMGRGPKGHEDLLAAARIVARRIPEARFVLAGNGVVDAGEAYRRRLMEECAKDEVLRDRVIFTGHVEDVPSLLAASDVAVQCSLTENLGGSIESLMMGKPMIVTRVGGLVDSVRHEETGLLVPPADPVALADAIVRLLQDRELAERLGANGRRFMLERFTLARTVDDLDALYAHTKRGAGYSLLRSMVRLPLLAMRVAPLIAKLVGARLVNRLRRMNPVPVPVPVPVPAPVGVPLPPPVSVSVPGFDREDTEKPVTGADTGTGTVTLREAAR